MNYFKVKAKCGHVGRNSYIIKDFYIKAENAKAAASTARLLPRVKHNQKQAIMSVEQIDSDEYLKGCEINRNDKYFNARNIQEQRITCAINVDEIFKEVSQTTYRKKTHKRRIMIELAFIKETLKERGFAYE